MTAAELVPLIAVLPVLMASAISDLRHLRIPNAHVLLALAIFAVTAPFLVPLGEIGDRAIVAFCAFVIGFVLFALRLCGGGDVKMFPVVLLFVPSAKVILFLQVFAAALLVASLGILAAQRLPASRRLAWSSMDQRGHVPVAVSFALAALALTVILAYALWARTGPV